MTQSRYTARYAKAEENRYCFWPSPERSHTLRVDMFLYHCSLSNRNDETVTNTVPLALVDALVSVSVTEMTKTVMNSAPSLAAHQS